MKRLWLVITCAGILVWHATIAAAAEPPAKKVAAELERYDTPAWRQLGVGVTRGDQTIWALVDPADLDAGGKQFRILLVAGLDGSTVSVEAARLALRWFSRDAPAAIRQEFAVSIVPIANPAGWVAGSGTANGSGGDPTRGYPPRGDAYASPTDPEAAYLWRWIGMQAPDLVVEIRTGPTTAIVLPEGAAPELQRLAAEFPNRRMQAATDDLLTQLPRHKPAGMGAVPAIRFEVQKAGTETFLPELLSALTHSKFPHPSEARREFTARSTRTPVEVAGQLAGHYGQTLPEVAYIPAMALLARVRLGKLTNDASHLEAVERIVAPYLAGEKPTLTDKPSGSTLSGHLVFGELAELTGNKRYTELVLRAADLGFDQGQPRAAMPFHEEMSDAVFMGCPILTQAGKLTGNVRYHDQALRHLQFMLKLNLRPHGLHRHSPLDNTAWGRGNGFPALGLALSLADLPTDHPGRAEMLAAFRSHLMALLPHQDATGMWHQVIDHPGSYRELTCTCMITYALLRGMQAGWLDGATFEPAALRGWQAIRTRVAADGSLVDVCTGTGKQASLRAYLDRTAILGRDPRGGAMALLVATEMAAWEAANARGPAN